MCSGPHNFPGPQQTSLAPCEPLSLPVLVGPHPLGIAVLKHSSSMFFGTPSSELGRLSPPPELYATFGTDAYIVSHRREVPDSCRIFIGSSHGLPRPPNSRAVCPMASGFQRGHTG